MAEAASIWFLKWDRIFEREKPFQIFAELLPDSEDQRKSNVSFEEHEVTVNDLRGHEQQFKIDAHGFMVNQLPGFRDLSNHEMIEKQYLPAMKHLLKQSLVDAGSVFVLDWRIRNSEPPKIEGDRLMYSDWSQPLLPSNYAHVDISAMGVIQRIQREYPELSTRMLRQRVRAINVWKPLANPVTEWSLAICDGTTVQPSDLVETDSLRQGFQNTFHYVQYSEKHKWYFIKHQLPDEVLIFKHFDSDPEVQVSTTIHSSIRHSNTSENSTPRKSIEVRTLVFSEEFNE